MVIDKSEHCYENWTKGGYNNTVYDCTHEQAWFFKQFIPRIRKHQGKRLKPANLIAGFNSTGICPLNLNEVLERLPADEKADNSFNELVFNDSVLEVLRENCG